TSTLLPHMQRNKDFVVSAESFSESLRGKVVVRSLSHREVQNFGFSDSFLATTRTYRDAKSGHIISARILVLDDVSLHGVLVHEWGHVLGFEDVDDDRSFDDAHRPAMTAYDDRGGASIVQPSPAELQALCTHYQSGL